MEWQHLTCQMVCWNMSQVTIRWKNPMTLKLDEEFVVIPYRCPDKESSVKPPSYSILLLWDFLNVPPLRMVLATWLTDLMYIQNSSLASPAFVDLCYWFPFHSDLKRSWIFFHWKNVLWSLDTKNSEILQNFELKSRKYPQPAVRIHKIKIYSVPSFVYFLIFRFQACEGVDDLTVWDLGSPHCRPCSRLCPGPRAGIVDILEDQVENEDFRSPGRPSTVKTCCGGLLLMPGLASNLWECWVTSAAVREPFRRHWDSNSAKL